MFKLFLFVLSPEDRSLITRLLDFLEGKQQAKIDAMTAQLTEVLEKLRASNAALRGAITNQQ